MAHPLKNKLVAEVAAELGDFTDGDRDIRITGVGNFKQTRRIIDSQFAYVAKIMAEGRFEGVRLANLGKFFVKQGRANYVNNPGQQE